jgi:predicted nucleic-acid-binding protein
MSVFVLGADTNLLVRFVTGDDPTQSPQSLQLVTKDSNQPIHICIVALVEMVWVLTKVKRRPIQEVLNVCRDLIMSSNFRVEQDDLVARAIEDAATAGCDLADALIALVNQKAGCEATATFDTAAQRLEHMVPVERRL